MSWRGIINNFRYFLFLGASHCDNPLLNFRMKREVDSTLVEKGVAERVRLSAMYTRKQDELQRQHDTVKQGLEEHRAKVSVVIDLICS